MVLDVCELVLNRSFPSPQGKEEPSSDPWEDAVKIIVDKSRMLFFFADHLLPLLYQKLVDR